MGALILPSRFTQQPQVAAPVGGTGSRARLVLATIPGVAMVNASSGAVPQLGGSPTTWAPAIDAFGRDVMTFPGGGSNGIAGIRFGAETVGISNDFTFIWVGRPMNGYDNFGGLMIRGADGAGNGWNLAVAIGGGSSDGSNPATFLRASYVDTSPAQYDAILNGLTITPGMHQRFALVKRGSTIKVFDWRSRASTSTTAGNVQLRTSTAGIALGLDGSGNNAAHAKHNTGLAFDTGLSDNEVWSLLDNPWQVYKAPPRRLLVATSSAGATASPSGVSATGSIGTPVAHAGATAAPVGVSATCAVGSAASSGAALTPVNGVTATSSVGTVTASSGASANPSGVGATALVGAPTAIASATASPFGVSASAQIGTASASGAAPGAASPLGVSATAAVGAPVGTGGARIAVTGVTSTASVGTATASGGGAGVAQSAGVSATASVGQATAGGYANVLVNGIAAFASVGTATAGAGSSGIASPLGIGASASVGQATGQGAANVSVNGVTAAASVGTASAGAGSSGTAVPQGVTAAASIGTASASAGAIASPAGVVATATIGQPAASGQIIVSGNAHPLGVTAYAQVGIATAHFGSLLLPNENRTYIGKKRTRLYAQ